MLLSELEKNSGYIPGPVPAQLRYDRDQAARSRVAARWRRQSLGASYVPLEQQGFSFANNDISQPVNFQQYSVADAVQPYQIQATPIDFHFDPASIQLPTLPDFSAAPPGATYSPSWSLPNYTPSLPDLPAPSFSVMPQAPANPAPAGSSTDWLTNALKIATIGAQTYVAAQAVDQGRPYITPGTFGAPGVTQPTMYPQPVYQPGVTAGVPIGGQALTPAMLAALTPQQRVQYATMYPGTGGASPTDFVSSLMGGMDMTKIALWGGAGLLVMMMLMRRPQNA